MRILGPSFSFKIDEDEDIMSIPIDISLIKKPFGVLFTAFGCPFRCSYCLAWKLSSYRRRQLKVLEKELYMFQEKGIRNIAFYDDALLFRYEEHLLKLYNIIKKNNFRFSFYLPNGINARYVTKKNAYILKDMGVKNIRIGYEVDKEDLQIKLGNKVKRKDLEKAILLLKRSGFKDIGVYIMFHYDVSIEDFIFSSNFIHSLGVFVKPVLYSPIPNTIDFVSLIKKYPMISNPLYQNDSFFLFYINKINYSTWIEIKRYIDALNGKLKTNFL
jgi:radical SAM superfamily enzyme YgiQ (UPF0313 family)